MAKPIDPCDELSLLVGELAEYFAAQPGVRNVDDVVKSIQKRYPEMTREQVVDSMIALQVSRSRGALDELTKQLQKIRGEARTDRALREDIERLEPVLKNLPVEPKTTRERAQVAEAVKSLKEVQKRLAGLDRADKRIKEIERKIKKNDLSLQRPRKLDVKESLIAERDRLNKELNKLRADKKRREDLRIQIESMRFQLETGKIRPRQEKPEKPPPDDELTRLLFDRDRLKAKINAKIDGMAPVTIGTVLRTATSMPKLLMAGYDLSFIGRQGAIALVSGRFKIAAKGFWEQFRAIKSEADLDRVFEQLMARPNAPLYRSTGLEMTRHMEELEGVIASFRKWSGAGFADRAFAAAANRIRADLFDLMYASLGNSATSAELKWLAQLINTMTLRSSMSPGVANAMNVGLFSARAFKARLSWLFGAPVWRAPTWRTAKLALRQYARFLIGAGVLWALAKSLGLLGSDDPRSSDHMKIKLGEARVDLFGGLTGYVTFMSRLATGETVPASGKNKDKTQPLRGPDVKFGRTNMEDVIWRWVASKASPTVSLGIDFFRGKEFGGAPFDPRRAVLNRVIPLWAQATFDFIEQEGVAKGSALGLMELLGLSVYHMGGEFGEGEPLPNWIIRLFGGEPKTLKKDKR